MSGEWWDKSRPGENSHGAENLPRKLAERNAERVAVFQTLIVGLVLQG